MELKNIEDVAEWFGSTVPRIERDIYKYTDCGAWITWDEQSVTIGSIVEGSDAEFSKKFNFPVMSEGLDDWMEELENLTDEAWHEANDEEDFW